MEFFRKAKRLHLTIALVVLLVLLLAWAIVRIGFGFDAGPQVDQVVSDVVIFGALGIFVWNRWLASEEKKRKQAEESAQVEATDIATESSESPQKK